MDSLYALASVALAVCAPLRRSLADNGEMRVIAGTYRSRQLIAPRGTETRPTSDRLRETLFNILAMRIPGCRFADLYAGTGAVGIEAISRGAEHVWFTEKSESALAAIRTNLKALKIMQGYTVEERGTGALLERLAKSAKKSLDVGEPVRGLLDVVYLDPPWEAEAEYASTLHLLGSARGQAMLASGALIVAEHSSKSPLAERYGELVQTRTMKQGDAALSFYAAATTSTE
jgi:16S rRNA (guanine(966)-N(2))-methyltransferase RsmD